jgi:hypothetical protein
MVLAAPRLIASSMSEELARELGLAVSRLLRALCQGRCRVV